jgi:S1-C subfamily serine protease
MKRIILTITILLFSTSQGITSNHDLLKPKVGKEYSWYNNEVIKFNNFITKARSYQHGCPSPQSLMGIMEQESCIYDWLKREFDKTVGSYHKELLEINHEYYLKRFNKMKFYSNQALLYQKAPSSNEMANFLRSNWRNYEEDLVSAFERIYLAENSKIAGKDNNKKRSASGTAFFINNKGNIVTNNHVVEGCSGPIKILYDKKNYQAKLISKDGNLDLAVLSSDIKPNQYLKLSKKSGDKLDRVVAAGYPLGYKISDELKLTAGIVSATKGWKDNINEFQIDAALNPGNSGGPVVNDAGNLFGVAVAGLADRQNLNFAIKSKAVKDFLDVNKVSYSTAAMEFDMDNKKRLKLLEDSTVFIYCN